MRPIVPTMRASACLLLLCATSVSFALTHTSRHPNFFADSSRCEYYAKVHDILRPDDVSLDNPKMRMVDGMLYDYVDIASIPPVYKDCVPFMSQYSDCSLENICMGCTVCQCTMLGRWNCSQVQRCRPDHQLEVNHRILIIAMEHLLEEDKALARRRKRSLDVNESFKDHDDFSKWMYGISPFDFEDINSDTKHIDMGETTSQTNITDPDIFNFLRFLIDVGSDFHLDKDEGNVTLDENINKTNIGNTTEHDSTSDYKNFVNMLDNVSRVTDSILSIISNNTSCVSPRNNDDSSKTEIPINTFALFSDYLKKQSDLLNEIIKPHNITKREIFQTDTERNHTNNITIFIKNITENTFYPLENIIKVKQEELNELINIRDNLLDSINAYVGLEVSNITANSKIQTSDLHFIIYKIDKRDSSNLSNILRTDDRSLLDKYQMKLKSDIGEVIRDIAVIQRLPKSSDVTNELKFLIRALKHYVKKLPGRYNQKININSTNQHFRRRFDNDKYKITNPILLLNNILELLDKDMPQGNVLSSLSTNAMKLIKRIINQLYVDELVGINAKLNDKKYSLSNDLKEIGNKWQKRMTDINNCIPSEKLHKMKLFHIELSADIDTFNDILTLCGFAERRRMSLLYDVNSEKIVMDNLIKIHNDIKEITAMANKPKNRNPSPNRRRNKQGFLQKVKRLLKKSKQNIRGILQKNKATPDMIKQLAKKRLNDITKKKLSKYEDTMYRWQDNLNIVPRIKRSPNEFHTFMNRVKHIIPGYLHKKVIPAVDSKKKHKNGTRNVMRRVKKHRRHKTSEMPVKRISTTTAKTRNKKHRKHH